MQVSNNVSVNQNIFCDYIFFSLIKCIHITSIIKIFTSNDSKNNASNSYISASKRSFNRLLSFYHSTLFNLLPFCVPSERKAKSIVLSCYNRMSSVSKYFIALTSVFTEAYLFQLQLLILPLAFKSVE